MEPFRVAHLFIVGLWGGLVLGETVLELSARDPAEARFAARLHYLTDVFVEIPLLIGVVASGALLAARAWPFAPLHWVKLGCALLAITANLVCIRRVVVRHAQAEDAEALAASGRRVRATWVGVPFGLAALWIGLACFHRW